MNTRDTLNLVAHVVLFALVSASVATAQERNEKYDHYLKLIAKARQQWIKDLQLQVRRSKSRELNEKLRDVKAGKATYAPGVDKAEPGGIAYLQVRAKVLKVLGPKRILAERPTETPPPTRRLPQESRTLTRGSGTYIPYNGEGFDITGIDGKLGEYIDIDSLVYYVKKEDKHLPSTASETGREQFEQRGYGNPLHTVEIIDEKALKAYQENRTAK